MSGLIAKRVTANVPGLGQEKPRSSRVRSAVPPVGVRGNACADRYGPPSPARFQDRRRISARSRALASCGTFLLRGLR